MNPTDAASRPTIIAEIGCNHKGELPLALEMVQIAKVFCGADVVKFQKRTPKECLTPDEYAAPHPNPANAYGETYGAHREFLEFNVDQHRQIQKRCAELGIDYSTSVWDVTSARETITLNPKLVKVPSACNLNKGLLAELCDNYAGEIHISLGMTHPEEEEEIVRFVEGKGRAKQTVLYACTSGYPVAFPDICLYEITRLKDRYGKRVKSIAFSGHHLGIAADIAAMTLGASHIERHFTLDRTWKGTDHAASLEPDGLRRLCRDTKNVSQALGFKQQHILPVEAVQRAKLKANQIRW